jgi:competence protein ComEC
MHFIDVGQGDCTFIAANGKTMLVDCGENSEADNVESYLRKLNVSKLDYIIATHPHSDHMGGMHSIIDAFDVGEVIIPHIPDEQIPTSRFYELFLDSCAASKVKVSEAEVGTELQLGDAHIEFIAPDGSHYDDLNNYSLSFILTHGKNTFLLTGDAEKESESAMLESDSLRKIDLYKAGHHGSAYSSTKELLEVIRPDTVIISCGKNNSYGHPADSTVKRLKKHTKQIFRTDINGSIIVESDGEQLAITPERS